MESKFKDYYKTKPEEEQPQERRRKLLLKHQKTQRTQALDENRGLQEFVETFRQKIYLQKSRRKTYNQKYDQNHSLQISEWLKERPEDLEKWYLLPCPKGQRCLLIACNGKTEMYNKAGKLMFSFRSKLQGDRDSRHELTILDCIYIDKLSRFYVIDALSLGNQDLLHCDTEFRFYWIKSRFDELQVDKISEKNEYSILPIEFYDFDNDDDILNCLAIYPKWENNCPELDGFLFYHKKASYTCGTTPLVGWLFPFMIPEVLNMQVNQSYMLDKPDDYIDYLHFIDAFDENQLKKFYRREHKGKEKMQDDTFDNDLLDIINGKRELENFDL